MDITANYHGGADTSVLAHQLTNEKTRVAIRNRIKEKIIELGNATCSEIESTMNLTHQTASARISELLRDNIIYDTGERRLTDSNRPARVYSVKN